MKFNDPTFWWLVVGFAGQFLFFMRFFMQWLASLKHQKSHIPVVFWYFSLGGSILILAYAVYRKDPVFVVGQLFGSIVYITNLILIYKSKKI